MQRIVPFVNAVAVTAVGIWLAFLGEWWAIGCGLLALFTAHVLFALLMMPGVAFNAPAAYLKRRGWGLYSAPFLMLGPLYTFALISVWCVLVLRIFLWGADNASLLPMLAWSHAVALGPWAYMARQERQAGIGGPTMFATSFARIAYIATCGAVAFLDFWFFSAATLFLLVIAAGVILQTLYTCSRSAMESKGSAAAPPQTSVVMLDARRTPNPKQP